MRICRDFHQFSNKTLTKGSNKKKTYCSGIFIFSVKIQSVLQFSERGTAINKLQLLYLLMNLLDFFFLQIIRDVYCLWDGNNRGNSSTFSSHDLTVDSSPHDGSQTTVLHLQFDSLLVLGSFEC
jgi:hypothetical protein